MLGQADTRWSTGMRLKFHQKSGNCDFFGIPDFQSSYIWLEINRSQSQLSVELWILKIGPVSLVRFSKFYRKLGLRSIHFLYNIKVVQIRNSGKFTSSECLMTTVLYWYSPCGFPDNEHYQWVGRISPCFPAIIICTGCCRVTVTRRGLYRLCDIGMIVKCTCMGIIYITLIPTVYSPIG